MKNGARSQGINYRVFCRNPPCGRYRRSHHDMTKRPRCGQGGTIMLCASSPYQKASGEDIMKNGGHGHGESVRRQRWTGNGNAPLSLNEHRPQVGSYGASNTGCSAETHPVGDTLIASRQNKAPKVRGKAALLMFQLPAFDANIAAAAGHVGARTFHGSWCATGHYGAV